jgi:hypothetical protein
MARAPMPAPQMIETPAMRRSALLAKMLEQQRQPTEIKGGYGELGARLLAQGITQWGANRAEKAAAEEAAAQRQARIQSQAAILGLGGGDNAPNPMADALVPPPVTNTQEPVQASIAPAASVSGSALPPVGEPMPMADVPPMPQAPMPAPQVAPQQQGIFGLADNERRLAESLIASGDEAGLAELVAAVQSRNVRPDIRLGPDGTPYNASDPTALNQRFRNVQNVNGFMQDLNDPDIVGRYLPDLQPGEEPVYDQNRNIVGVRNLAGSIEALGQRERATQDAGNASRASYAGVIAGNEAAARAPYQFVNVQSPTGAPTTMSAASAAGQVFQGQTPSEAILQEGAARGEVEAANNRRTRASAAMRVLPTLDNMERLLPDVIAGFGAEQQLQIARATAGVNPDARRRASATQTFQNEARQVVSGILPMFGANPTEGERKYAEQMSGADVTYTPEAIQEGINLARSRAAREAVAADMPIPPRLARTLPRGTEFIGEDGQRYRVP